MNSLDVWRGPRLIGSLTRGRSGLRYLYEPGLLRKVGLNRPLANKPGTVDRRRRPLGRAICSRGGGRVDAWGLC